ncbi:homoserine kinase [Thermosyntropha sp.]|uniref:homoserine kinase n=1 Tax=Thermosyntropha sp. TaxID=2740820 RepID=UPI0025E45381|nr:homoserine kinase [Thermosyntropha sp.]MBO8159566.1 homoserine kinase [Thermosyntropha sp.]
MITVKVPATAANLGSGFDTLGLALDLMLEVKIKPAVNENKIEFCGYGASDIKQNPDSNLILKAMHKVFTKAGAVMPPIELYAKNNIPVGKGLGSSAAAIIAGLYAGNMLLKNRFNEKELINMAVFLEGHADNVVPAAVGGLTAVMVDKDEVYYKKLKFPGELKIIALVPDFILPTKKARTVLPEKVGIKEVTSALQKACFLALSLNNGDFEFLDKAMSDELFQTARKRFIPGFDEVIREARKAGALGAALSGAGPSIIAFSLEREHFIGKRMQDVWALHGINSDVFYLKAYENGVICEKTL